jgi:hypothetical protein
MGISQAIVLFFAAAAFRIGLAGIVVSIGAPGAGAAEDIRSVVKTCVQSVRAQGYAWFDAFYNPADKTVQNSITYVYQQSALFLFDKCMAEHEFPLTYK